MFGLLIIFSINTLALNLDCEGKIFKNLETDVDSEVTNDPGTPLQETISIRWTDSTLEIKENMLYTPLGKLDLYIIDRKNLSFIKEEFNLGKDKIEKKGQCKIWEKPADNVIQTY